MELTFVLEWAGKDRRNVRRGRRTGSAATDRAVFPAREGTGAGLAWRETSHTRMMPGKGSKGNPDPSPIPAPAAGKRVAGRDDRACLPRSAGGGCWRGGVGNGGLGRGNHGCNNAVRGRSAGRSKTPRDSRRRCRRRPVAVERFRRRPPCALADGARQRQHFMAG